MLLLCMSSFSFAEEIDFKDGRFGVEIVPGGPAFGVQYYTENYGIGGWTSAQINNASSKTASMALGLWAEIRTKLEADLYLGYGLDIDTAMGKTNGTEIESKISLAPYVNFEKVIAKNLILCIWTQPIAYSSQKIGVESISTYSLFNTKLALQYFF